MVRFALFVSVLILALPRPLCGQTFGPISSPMVNGIWYAGDPNYPSYQSAVTAACATTAGGHVIRIIGYSPTDTPTTPTGGCTKVDIEDDSATVPAFYIWTGTAYRHAYFDGWVLGAAGCASFTPLAGGQACTTTISLGITAPNTSYFVECVFATAPAAPMFWGPIVDTSTTTFTVTLYTATGILSTSGGGTLNCHYHVQ